MGWCFALLLLFVLELLQGPVPEPRVGAIFVVVTTPALDDHPRFGSASEPLHAQPLVAELAVQALGGAILPRLAGVDVRRFDALLLQPFQHRMADELGAVVRAQVARRAVFADQALQHFDHATRAQATLHVDRQRLVGPLIGDDQTDLPPVALPPVTGKVRG